MNATFGLFRHSTVLFLLLAGGLSLVLFSVKYEVQDLEQELKDLNRAIVSDREVIHILKAEWAHLNDPERLRLVADRFFNLAPVRPDQMITLDDLPLAAPMPGPDGKESGQ